MRDSTQPPPKLADGKNPGKLVVVESVYHVRPDAQPVGVESRYTRWLGCGDAPFVDEFHTSARWQQVQTGRIAEVGQLCVENLEGNDLTKVPTPAERAGIAARVVELFVAVGGVEPGGYCQGCAVVRPGESARFEPPPGATIHARCRDANATARVRVTVIPA